MNGPPDTNVVVKRNLSQALAKVTLLLALILGVLSGAMQIGADLRQEKSGVQYAAEEFLASVAPSAASAAYNFYDPAAVQVVEGLFTQRAVSAVRIVNEGSVMIERTRELDQTLPNLVGFTGADTVVLQQPLYAPLSSGSTDVIGSISITVDRSVVAPAFVQRMVYYFLFATIKNFILGILLILIVYGALARHIVTLAEKIGHWTPEQGRLSIPSPPSLLKDTELDLLGQRVEALSTTATGRINEVKASHLAVLEANTQLNEISETLSHEVHRQNVDLQHANARLKEMAERDALTGLFNRGSFDATAGAAFRAAIEAGQDLAVLLIDVDFFKAYNDFYGHQSGDHCLIDVAQIIQTTLQGDTTLVARYGGEEFIALFTGDDARQAEDKACLVHDELAKVAIEHQRSTAATHITVSIGLSQAQVNAGEDVQLDHLLSAADEALYEAKRSGRKRTVVSTQTIRERVRQTRLQAHNLLKAIEARAFEPFFQPQYDARNGQVTGFEVLVRWQREDGSIATPAAFMETASRNGLLLLIDKLVLEETERFLAAAQERGVPIPRLSLNAPRENLLDQRYVQDLIAMSARFDTQISIELLETAMFDAPDEMLMWQLQLLSDANIEIEIDDFGTGHTSILSLMTLQPSRLKIARELVMPLADGPHHNKIVTSIVQISTALGVDVLAEGVETKEMSKVLVDCGCPNQQGYLFARPMTAAAVFEKYGPDVAQIAP